MHRFITLILKEYADNVRQLNIQKTVYGEISLHRLLEYKIYGLAVLAYSLAKEMLWFAVMPVRLHENRCVLYLHLRVCFVARLRYAQIGETHKRCVVKFKEFAGARQ